MKRRSLDELINVNEPAWQMVLGWVDKAVNPVEILPASDPERNAALELTQVTTRSPMGAIIYESGGILVDHGWLRILGSGHARLSRSLPEWNETIGHDLRNGAPPFLLIAD